jgi:3-deoxy-D-manno-octulosonic-acid transferase
MRIFYSIAWWLALPLVLLRLWWRGRKEPGYRQHLAERFGFYRYDINPTRPCIWLHAVSVGETRAAEPLLDALLESYPDHVILLTHMTPTGRATGQSLFGRHVPRIVQAYLPYDTGWMVGRLLAHFSPRLCILMETEVWPNLIARCARQGVPVALVNARLSSRSLAKAQRLSWLMQDAARAISCVAAQTEADASRLRQFGAPNVQVTGSIKFDVTPPEAALTTGAQLRTQIGPRPVLLCASTRDGEEALIMDALASLGLPDVLLLIVPRHPQRFDEVAQMAVGRGLRLARRSEMRAAPSQMVLSSEINVLLGDSMGEMFAYYAACDVAFIGGSLLPLGGQNLIEACALGKPVLIGPHTFNFSVVSEDAIAAGAALRVADATVLMQEASRLLSDPSRCAAMGQQARAFALQHRGATGRTLALLQPLLQAR